MNSFYEEGEIVEHILTKDWMVFIKNVENKCLCRTKDYQLIEFEKFEIRKKR